MIVVSLATELALAELARKVDEERSAFIAAVPNDRTRIATVYCELSRDFAELLAILRRELGCP